MRFGKLAGQDVGWPLRCRELFLASLILRMFRLLGGFAGVERSWRRIACGHLMAIAAAGFRTIAAIASSRMRFVCNRVCCHELNPNTDRSRALSMR